MGLFTKKQESLNERIKNLRKEKGWTQLKLAEQLNITDKAVSKWERGKSLPDITLLSKLAEIFEVEVEDILSGEINKSNNDINVDELMEELQISIEIRNKKLAKSDVLFIGIVDGIKSVFGNTINGYLTFYEKCVSENIKLGDKDIEYLANELAFYLSRKKIGMGGAF